MIEFSSRRDRILASVAISFALSSGVVSGAEPVRIELGPFVGTLIPPNGWALGGKELATRLLKADGVKQEPSFSLASGNDQVIYGTTKVVEGVSVSAAELAGGGADLAQALGIPPAAMRCAAMVHPRGFDFSACQAVGAGTGLSITGKGKPTAAIWIDIPVTVSGPGGLVSYWTSVYYRGPGAAVDGARGVVEAVLDSFQPGPGLAIVEARVQPTDTRERADPKAEPAVSTERVDEKELARVFLRAVGDDARLPDLQLLTDLSTKTGDSALSRVSRQLAGRVASKVALRTWEEILRSRRGEAELRAIALEYLSASLAASDEALAGAVAEYLRKSGLTLRQLSDSEVARIFREENPCGLAASRSLVKILHDFGAGSGSATSGALAASLADALPNQFRGRLPQLAEIATRGSDGSWRLTADRTGSAPPIVADNGRVGFLSLRGGGRRTATYSFEPEDNFFELLGRACAGSRRQ